MRTEFLALVLLLAGCKPAIPSPAPTSLEHSQAPASPAAPPTVSDFSGDFNVTGTEPFWSVQVRGGKTLTLERPDSALVVATAPGAVIGAGQATWNANTAEGGVLTLTLTVGQCSDGMSDRSYPMAAEAQVEGRTLIGCAARPGDTGGQPKP